MDVDSSAGRGLGAASREQRPRASGLRAADDRLLLVFLAVALVIVFARPILYLLDFAREIEQRRGLALVPALTILTVVLVFNRQRKRQEAHAQARAAETDAREAQIRANELERLVSLGQSLGRSLDIEAVRDAVMQHLPRLSGAEGTWVMACRDGLWQVFCQAPGDNRAELDVNPQELVERVADDVSTTPLMESGHLCMPMTVGGQLVGLLAVPKPESVTDARRRVLAGAAMLIGISLRNAQLFREVKDNSLRDGLTGCYNKTHALEVIATELRRSRRSRAPVSLIMFDLDHFKQVNDHRGHLCGDAVLAAVGTRMRDALRGSDFKCRYGGEEFLVLLPETPIDGARRVAETLRRTIADRPFVWKDERLTVTASFGVSAALPSEGDVQAVIGRADQALYAAKRQGRNCVEVDVQAAVA